MNPKGMSRVPRDAGSRAGEGLPGAEREKGRRLDPAGVLLQVARHVEAAALVMAKHRVVSVQQVCACGRIAVRLLPVFGLRCEVASGQWQLAYSMLRTVVEQMARPPHVEDEGRAVGRAGVPLDPP